MWMWWGICRRWRRFFWEGRKEGGATEGDFVCVPPSVYADRSKVNFGGGECSDGSEVVARLQGGGCGLRYLTMT